jgi:hypothetical protein
MRTTAQKIAAIEKRLARLRAMDPEAASPLPCDDPAYSQRAKTVAERIELDERNVRRLRDVS